MAVCETFFESLNLECLLVNVFSGSIDIFIALAFIFISGICAKFKVPNEIFLILCVLFLSLMVGFFPNILGLWVLVVLIIGFVIFYSIGKIGKN
jgi:hypothetical protein